MSQQHIENSEQLLRSLEPNTSRLPLRKRVAPVLKWQPVETPQEHIKQKPYPLQQYPSLEDSNSETTETDEEKQKPLKKDWITKEDGKRSFTEDNNLNRVSSFIINIFVVTNHLTSLACKESKER
jgi:hypothetical protein